MRLKYPSVFKIKMIFFCRTDISFFISIHYLCKSNYSYPITLDMKEKEKTKIAKIKRGFYLFVWNWASNQLIKSIYLFEKNFVTAILDPINPWNIYVLSNKTKGRLYSINFMNDKRYKIFSSSIKKLEDL